MKKILLILSFLYSFSFADYTTVVYNGTTYWVDTSDVCQSFSTWTETVSSVNTVAYSVTTTGDFSGCGTNAIRKIECIPDGIHAEYDYKCYATLKSYNMSDLLDEEPTTCPSNSTQLDDGSCSCNSGYALDSSGEVCCSAPTLDKSNVQPDWINLNISSSTECMTFLSDTQRSGTWVDNTTTCSETGTTTVTVGECWGEAVSPCEVVNNPEITRPDGFIYKGKVDFESDCSSYVDYKTYSKSSTSPVDSDCATNTQLYCYLLPIDETLRTDNTSDDNTSNTVGVNDSGDTVTYNNDLNSDGYNLTTAPLNEILSQMQKDYAENSQFHTWVKDYAGNWVPQDNSNLVRAQEDTTSAVNSQTQSLGDKLDTINESIKDLNVSNATDMNATNDLLNKILTGDDYDLNSTDSSTVLGYINDTVDSLKSDVTTIQSNFDDLIDTLQGDDFSTFFDVSDNEYVNTCPITKEFSTENGVLTNVTIDYCDALVPLRPFFYTVSFLGFSFGFLYLGFKLLVLLGV